MSAFNFCAQFVPAIEAGLKCQTIRAKRVDGRNPKPGDALQLYTGMRTTKCRKIKADPVCRERYEIEIGLSDDKLHAYVVLDGRRLEHHQVIDLATADGFKDSAAFIAFFSEKHALPFYGYLYKW